MWRGEYSAPQYAPVMDALFARGSAVVPDVRSLGLPDTVVELMTGFALNCVLAVPFFERGGRIAAALMVAMADAPRPWTSEEVSLAETVAALTRTLLNEGVWRTDRARRCGSVQFHRSMWLVCPTSLPPGQCDVSWVTLPPRRVQQGQSLWVAYRQATSLILLRHREQLNGILVEHLDSGQEFAKATERVEGRTHSIRLQVTVVERRRVSPQVGGIERLRHGPVGEAVVNEVALVTIQPRLVRRMGRNRLFFSFLSQFR